MKIDIITPDKSIFSGDVTLAQVPGSKGSFAILKNHAPIISTLEKGIVRVVGERNDIKLFEIDGGVIEVRENKITILAD